MSLSEEVRAALDKVKTLEDSGAITPNEAANMRRAAFGLEPVSTGPVAVSVNGADPGLYVEMWPLVADAVSKGTILSIGISTPLTEGAPVDGWKTYQDTGEREIVVRYRVASQVGTGT